MGYNMKITKIKKEAQPQPKRIKSQNNEVKGQYTVRSMLNDISKWKIFLASTD